MTFGIFANKSIAPLAVLAILMQPACAHHEQAANAPVRHVAAAPDLPPVELGETWTAENDKQVDEIIQTTTKMLVARTGKDTFVRRDAHPKHHGCAKAFFKVDSSALPAELRTGVFAADAPAEYPAWIRFSNGNPDGATAPDKKADIRGMAVKLLNVEGANSGSQDFLMCSAKEFFSKNGADYLALHRALGSKLGMAGYLLTHPKNAFLVNKARIVPANPLQTPYFSSLPYKLGGLAMRFKVVPVACAPDETKDAAPGKNISANYLRERLVATLAARPACFDFFVEPNHNSKKEPVENPTIAWNEKKSPYIKVATITLPQQTEIDSEAHLNFCENISFDPWHTLPGTRPLGQISRMRAKIYPAISSFRHGQNNIPRVEPRSHDICVGETAPLCATPKH